MSSKRSLAKGRGSGEVRCPICEEILQSSPFSRTALNPHYRKHHPEYFAWIRSRTKRLLFFLTPASVVLFLLMFTVFPCSGSCRQDPFSWLGFYSIMGYVGLWGLMLLSFYRKVAGFKRAWREEHGGEQVSY